MSLEHIKQTMLLAMSEHHSGNADEARRIVDAQLDALEAAGVRLVPVEVTENMHDAFFYTRDHAWPKHRDERRAEGRGWRTLPYVIWDAMLAASPYARKEPGQ